MENKVNARLKEIIEAQGLTEEAASLKSGLDRSYFRKLFERGDASPRGRTLQKIADGLGVDVADLLTDAPATHASGSEVRPAKLSLPARVDMPNDVPVRGTAAGSHLKGAFQFTSDAIDYVRRPPALMGARDIYALYVEGSSMEPQYFPGDLVYVHPHKPPRVGDVIVVQAAVDEVNVEATLGVYQKRTEQFLVILKRNPEASVHLKRDRVKAIHKVLTTNELFGV